MERNTVKLGNVLKFMDKITKAKRSYIMSHIKGRDTKPELLLFDALTKLGMIFERHFKLLGNPDIVFTNERLVIFVDGDFWHGGDFKKRKDTLPEYWVNKISRNIRRDRRYRAQLKKEGWKVLRLWEHQILKNPTNCVKRILKLLDASQQIVEPGMLK